MLALTSGLGSLFLLCKMSQQEYIRDENGKYLSLYLRCVGLGNLISFQFFRGGQIPWLGAIILIYFLFWTFLAHMIFALFMGPYALIDPTWSFDLFLTPRGAALGVVELIVGGASAFFLFSLTAVSLPMLLENELDFVTAMLLSMRATRQNLVVMGIWAIVIAVLTIVALVPYFLGLFVVLPVLGHATWHIYRRVLYLPV